MKAKQMKDGRRRVLSKAPRHAHRRSSESLLRPQQNRKIFMIKAEVHKRIKITEMSGQLGELITRSMGRSHDCRAWTIRDGEASPGNPELEWVG